MNSVKAFAAAVANELSARGLLGAPKRIDERVVGEAMGDGDAATAATRAAIAAATELCDNPSVLEAVLRLPMDEELAAAAVNAPDASAQDRWVTLAWRDGGGGESDDDDDDDDDDDGFYRVREGDTLRYEIKWYPPEAIDPDDPVSGVLPGDDSYSLSPATSTSTVATSSAHVAIDFECDDGDRLSLYPDATDQHGLSSHASADLRGAMRTRGDHGWLKRVIAMPPGLHGKRVKRWLASCESDVPARVRASARHVRVVDENGDEVATILSSAGTPRIVRGD